MSRRTARAGALALTLVLAVSACGGGDDEPAKKDAPAAKPTVSKAVRSYQDKVAAVCGPAMKKLRASVDDVDVNKATKAEQDAAIATIGQGFVDEAAALRKIDPPDEIAAEVEVWLDSLEKAGRRVKDKGAALLGGDTPPFADADARAQALGVLGCLTTAR